MKRLPFIALSLGLLYLLTRQRPKTNRQPDAPAPQPSSDPAPISTVAPAATVQVVQICGGCFETATILLKTTSGKYPHVSYLMPHVLMLAEYIHKDMWAEVASFDEYLPEVALEAFVNAEMYEEAEALRKAIAAKNPAPSV